MIIFPVRRQMGFGMLLGTTGDVVLLVWHALAAAIKSPPRPRLFLDQLHEVGVRSLSIVTVTAVFTGMVMALQLGYFLSRFGAKIFVNKIVGVAIVTELGPVLTALMIGGRVGAGMAAELGTMKVTEQVDALRSLGVDLDVRCGETMVILGRSGSGKSVLLKHLNGLLRPDSGSIHVFGAEVTAIPEGGLSDLRRRIGILFQGGALFDSMTVEDNVGFAFDTQVFSPAAPS